MTDVARERGWINRRAKSILGHGGPSLDRITNCYCLLGGSRMLAAIGCEKLPTGKGTAAGRPGVAGPQRGIRGY